jgi:hypothetical protein
MLGNLRNSIEGLLRSMVWNEWDGNYYWVRNEADCFGCLFQKGVKKKVCTSTYCEISAVK